MGQGALNPWVVAAVVIGSFVLTQILVHFLQRRRLERIERKSLELCETVPAGSNRTAAQADGSAKPPAVAGNVPITIVTGFLGSGKTTLVNRMLTSNEHGLRIAVIENELGAISIDHALIDGERQAHMPEGVLVLKNGCICCSGETPGSELERVLDKLLEMGRLEGGSLPFDCVVIETTGMADPSPMLQILYRREMAGSRFYLDALICVIDCKHVLRHLRPSGPFGFARRRAEVEKQLALADRVILNKTGDGLEMIRRCPGDGLLIASFLPLTRPSSGRSRPGGCRRGSRGALGDRRGEHDGSDAASHAGACAPLGNLRPPCVWFGGVACQKRCAASEPRASWPRQRRQRQWRRRRRRHWQERQQQSDTRHRPFARCDCGMHEPRGHPPAGAPEAPGMAAGPHNGAPCRLIPNEGCACHLGSRRAFRATWDPCPGTGALRAPLGGAGGAQQRPRRHRAPPGPSRARGGISRVRGGRRRWLRARPELASSTRRSRARPGAPCFAVRRRGRGGRDVAAKLSP